MKEEGMFEEWTPDQTKEHERQEKERLDNMSPEELDAQYDVAKEDTTCWECSENKTCKYAWDPYNTDGDCLADK